MRLILAALISISVISAYAAVPAKQPSKTAEQSEVKPLPLEKAKSYDRYTEYFRMYSSNPMAKVAMIGDSITQGAYWNELMERGDIINRGIPGDTTQGILERLDTVKIGKVDTAFILMGINDISKHQTPQQIYDRYVKIVEFLVNSGIKPYIQSTLYLSVKNPNYKMFNPRIKELDGMLKDYADKHGITFIDLNAVLSKDSVLVDEYSYDGTHLNSTGYLIWKNTLNKYMPAYVPEASQTAATQDSQPTDQTQAQPDAAQPAQQ